MPPILRPIYHPTCIILHPNLLRTELRSIYSVPKQRGPRVRARRVKALEPRATLAVVPALGDGLEPGKSLALTRNGRPLPLLPLACGDRLGCP